MGPDHPPRPAYASVVGRARRSQLGNVHLGTWKYTAYTSTSDGSTFTHVGTLEGARRKAIAYAKSAYPASEYDGYGPTILVVDAETGEEMIRYRM